MSRSSNTRSTTHRLFNRPQIACDSSSESQVICNAVTLFGSDAPTAVAFCALEAWSEGNEAEYQFWSRVFQRMRN